MEADRNTLSKEVVKEHIITRTEEEAYAALIDGCVLHGHIPPPTPLDIPTIVILRDPRAAMVSWFRAKLQSKTGIMPSTPDERQKALFKKWIKRSGQRAANYIRPIHDGWLVEPPRDTLLIVRYETFFTEETMQLIADFTGKEALDPNEIYGQGRKYSGLPSTTSDWYDDNTEKRFIKTWGKALVQSIDGEGHRKSNPLAKGGKRL